MPLLLLPHSVGGVTVSLTVSSVMPGCLYPPEHSWTDFQDIWYPPVWLQFFFFFFFFFLSSSFVTNRTAVRDTVRRIIKCRHVARYLARFVLDSSWYVMEHGDARKGKWRGNWRMELVASTRHTTLEHGVSSITTADAHTSAASSWLNWRPLPI